MAKRKIILLILLAVFLILGTNIFKTQAIETWMSWLTPTWRPVITSGSQDLSASTLSLTTSTTDPFRLIRVTLKASGGITETVTVTLDSGEGADYDVLLDSTDLVANTDYVYEPDAASFALIHEDDEIVVACTDNGSANTVYATIYTEKVRGKR